MKSPFFLFKPRITLTLKSVTILCFGVVVKLKGEGGLAGLTRKVQKNVWSNIFALTQSPSGKFQEHVGTLARA